MTLEKFKKDIDDFLANTSDEELMKYFPPGPTIEERLARLGEISGRKYLPPSLMIERQDIINELIDEEVLVARFDNELANRICTIFDFVEPNKERNEKIYEEAWSKQMLGK